MTIVSRVLGLVRDHYQAVFFGTGPIATAWEISYMLPNMLRNLLAEGVLSQAFIPVYSDELKKSREEAARAAGTVLVFLTVAVSTIVLVGILIFPWILPLYTGTPREEAGLMILISRIMFVFILTASLTAIFAGMENTHGSFVAPALSPILLNMVFISGYLVLDYLKLEPEEDVIQLAWVVVLGGFLQMGLQAWFVWRNENWPIFGLDLKNPALLKIFSLMAPAVLGASLFQINQLSDIALASYFIPDDVGAIPALRYAQRLIQLPTGIIGVALSTAILPALTASIRAGQEEKNGKEMGDALSFSMFLTVPASIGFLLLGPHIINLLFYGGAWDERSSSETWLALQFYLFGVPFYSMNKILTSSFFAYQDTKTPVRIMIVIILINFVMNLFLIHPFRQGGLAISSAFTGGLNTIFLILAIQKKMKTGDQIVPEFLRSVIRQIPLWILLFLGVYLLESFGTPTMEYLGTGFAGGPDARNVPRYISMVHILVEIPFAMGIYFIAGSLTGVPEMKMINGILKRKLK